MLIAPQSCQNFYNFYGNIRENFHRNFENIHLFVYRILKTFWILIKYYSIIFSNYNYLVDDIFSLLLGQLKVKSYDETNENSKKSKKNNVKQ